jgi:membrane-bound lytic murein transglycosylase D
MKRGLLVVIVLAFISVKAQEITFCGEEVPTHRKNVKNSLNAALNKNQKGFKNKALQAKIELYLPFFSIVLKQYGLPDDLKFIPLAESRLQRNAESGAGAAGVWQFMPLTANGEGLAATERNAVIKSTHAACRLLGKLYRQLHSWALVAAAYNYGIGNLSKSMTRQGINDYYTLQLNAETANYLYEILSFKILYQQQFDSPPLLAYDSGRGRPPVTKPTIPLPALPASPAYSPEWQKSGFTGSLAIDPAEGPGAVIIGPDTIALPATIVKDSYLRTAGALAFNTDADLQVTGFMLKANTIIKGIVYADKGSRAFISIQGVDLAPQLKDYSGEVYAADGRNGLPTNGRAGRVMGFNGGERVQLKFIRE